MHFHTHIWCSLFLSGPPPPLLLSSLLLLLAWFLFFVLCVSFLLVLLLVCCCFCLFSSSVSFLFPCFFCLLVLGGGWRSVTSLPSYSSDSGVPTSMCVHHAGRRFCREFPNSCELKRSPHVCHPLCWDWLLSKSGTQLTTQLHAVDGLAAYWSLKFCCSFFEWREFSGRSQ